jgi:hypothetical protein
MPPKRRPSLTRFLRNAIKRGEKEIVIPERDWAPMKPPISGSALRASLARGERGSAIRTHPLDKAATDSPAQPSCPPDTCIHRIASIE